MDTPSASSHSVDVVAKPQPKSPIVFDPDGNLALLAGRSEQEFRVCSRTVSRASPFFNRLLNGPFAEAKEGLVRTRWIVKLPDDDEGALALILHIIHSQFNLISPALPIAELFKICVLVNKYDLVEILRPWASGWCAAVEASHEIHLPDHRLLWIAWVLGHERIFMRTTAEVLYWATARYAHNRGEDLPILTTRRSHIIEEFVYVDSIGILDDIAQARMDIITRMMNVLQSILTDLLDSKVIGHQQCRSQHGCRKGSHITTKEVLNCRCFLLGAFTRSLYTMGMFPIPAPLSYTESVGIALAGMRFLDFPRDDGQGRHQDCDLNLWFPPMIKAIDRTFVLPLRYAEHMCNQRRKSGVPDTEEDPPFFTPLPIRVARDIV